MTETRPMATVDARFDRYVEETRYLYTGYGKYRDTSLFSNDAV